MRFYSAFYPFVLFSGLLVCVAWFALPFDWVGLSFFLIAIQSLIFIISVGPKNLSLIKINFTFNFLFFSIIPWIHYKENAVFWGARLLAPADYLYVNFIIFVSGFLVVLAYFLTKITRSKKINGFLQSNRQLRKSCLALLLILSFVSAFIYLEFNGFSIYKMLYRGSSYDFGMDGDSSSSNASKLIYGSYIRILPLFCFLYAVTEIKGRLIGKFLLFVLCVFCLFPTGMARYMVAMVYVPIALFFFKSLRDGVNFSFLLIVSIIFVFPFLENFRYFSGFDEIDWLPSTRFFISPHFDAYQNFSRVIQIGFISWGWQLLGPLFFYIPRTIWPDKPIGSGHALAELDGYIFSNISMPFLAEGYINFGILGVFVFSIFFGYLAKKADSWYQTQESLVGLTYFGSVYYVACGAMFFLLRGDLMSSSSYIVGAIFAALTVNSLVRRF